MTSRTWRLSVWLTSTIVGAGVMVCSTFGTFDGVISTIILAFLGILAFDFGIDRYFKTRLAEEIEEVRRRQVAAISGNGDDV